MSQNPLTFPFFIDKLNDTRISSVTYTRYSTEQLFTRPLSAAIKSPNSIWSKEEPRAKSQ